MAVNPAGIPQGKELSLPPPMTNQDSDAARGRRAPALGEMRNRLKPGGGCSGVLSARDSAPSELKKHAAQLTRAELGPTPSTQWIADIYVYGLINTHGRMDQPKI